MHYCKRGPKPNYLPEETFNRSNSLGHCSSFPAFPVYCNGRQSQCQWRPLELPPREQRPTELDLLKSLFSIDHMHSMCTPSRQKANPQFVGCSVGTVLANQTDNTICNSDTVTSGAYKVQFISLVAICLLLHN